MHTASKENDFTVAFVIILVHKFTHSSFVVLLVQYGWYWYSCCWATQYTEI